LVQSDDITEFDGNENMIGCREELDEVSNRRLTSMAHDIVKGLAYLADLKYVHR
jgi:hypothetical protein